MKDIKKTESYDSVFLISHEHIVHTPLKRACLPIPPPPQSRIFMYGAEGRIWTTDTGIFSPI